MRKYYVKEAKIFKYAPRWPMLVFIWVLYGFLHFYLKLIPDFSNIIFLFTLFGIVNYSRLSFNERYLFFGDNSLVYGTKDLTLWHIPLNKICRIEKEPIKGRLQGFNLCTEKIVIYTADNDYFELYNVFQEHEFFEIEAELKKIVAATNEAVIISSEGIIIV